MARNDRGKTGPGSIADTVAHLAIRARHAPRGFARVEYRSECARAEADRRLGPDHPAVATDLVDLAVPLRAAGRPDEAVPLLRRALARLTPGSRPV